MPLTDPEKTTGFVEVLLQTTWLEGSTTFGVGLTVILNELVPPEQPFAEGLTVIVAITGAELLFVAVNDAMFPDPPADKPIEGVLLIHV